MPKGFEQVEAKGLVKVYGATRALAGVSVSFQAGEITAVEGPNGSGKSTLLRLLSLVERPTRGSIRFGDSDPRKRASMRRQIGLLAHAAMVYPDLNAFENLHLSAALYGLGEARERIAELKDRFELGRFAERPVRTYSRGQLQRVALARAVLHQPRLLLLDEPSTGLDTASVQRLVQAMGQERERGAILVLVTHDPALTEALADRRVRLKSGRVLREAA